MADPQAALATQLKNIETRTGKDLAALRQMIAASGLVKHAEVRAWLQQQLGLGYGDANTLAHVARQAEAPAAPAEADPLDAIYAGPKAALRPLHEALMAEVGRFGAFEVAPKKGYVSLRRKKQFAMVGPATKDQIEIGLNAKDLPVHPRLKPQPAGGMCAYKLRLSSAGEIDAPLVGWLRAAYDAAG
jgi:hypothetical protein